MNYSRPYKAGKQIGWIAAAGWEMTTSIRSLRHEIHEHHTTVKEYLKNEHPVHSDMELDAMRHSYVSARMSQKHGGHYTAFMGYMNETVRDITNTNKQGARGMDLYNNRVGREFGLTSKTCSEKDVLDGLWDKTQNGELIVSEEEPRALEYSYRHDPHPVSNSFEKIKQFSNNLYHMPLIKIVSKVYKR